MIEIIAYIATGVSIGVIVFGVIAVIVLVLTSEDR